MGIRYLIVLGSKYTRQGLTAALQWAAQKIFSGSRFSLNQNHITLLWAAVLERYALG